MLAVWYPVDLLAPSGSASWRALLAVIVAFLLGYTTATWIRRGR